MTAAEIAMLAIAHPIACMVAVVLFVRCQVQMGRWRQEERDDQHVAEVKAWRVLDEPTQVLPAVPTARRVLDVTGEFSQIIATSYGGPRAPTRVEVPLAPSRRWQPPLRPEGNPQASWAQQALDLADMEA